MSGGPAQNWWTSDISTLPPASLFSVANQMDHQSCNRWSEAKVGGGVPCRGWNYCRGFSLMSTDRHCSTVLWEWNPARSARHCWLVTAPLRSTGLICLSREENLCNCGNEAALMLLPSASPTFWLLVWTRPVVFQDLGSSDGPPRNWKGIGIAMVVILAVMSLVILSVVLLTPGKMSDWVRRNLEAIGGSQSAQCVQRTEGNCCVLTFF